MTTYTVTGTFPEGTTGTVTFQRKEWLTSVSEGLIPPQRSVVDIEDAETSTNLRASEESGVAPDFTYWVYLDLDGYDQMVGRMYLTENSDLGDVFQWETPVNPEIFATKAELEALTEAVGNPVTEQDITDAIDGVTAAYEAADTGIEALITSEAGTRASADALLDGRLDDLEALPIPVVNTDGDPGTTIYIGTVEPADPPYDLALGDVWLDTTEA